MELLFGYGVVSHFVGMVFEGCFSPCSVDVLLGGFEGDAEQGIEIGIGDGIVFELVARHVATALLICQWDWVLGVEVARQFNVKKG